MQRKLKNSLFAVLTLSVLLTLCLLWLSSGNATANRARNVGSWPRIFDHHAPVFRKSQTLDLPSMPTVLPIDSDHSGNIPSISIAPVSPPGGAFSQTTSGACTQLLENTQLDVSGSGSIAPWGVYDPHVYFSDQDFVSPDHSLLFVDADSGDPSPTQDAFGQIFDLPNNLEKVTIEYQSATANTNSNDDVFGNLWTVDSNDNLDQSLGGWTVGESPNAWKPQSVTISNPSDLAPLEGRRLAILLFNKTNGQNPGEITFFDDIKVTACVNTDTPTPTDTATPTPKTPTPTPSSTPSSTPTSTQTPTPTDTPTSSPTDTPTPTNSPTPDRQTNLFLAFIARAVVPTHTPTPTNTPGPTNTPTPSSTPSPTKPPGSSEKFYVNGRQLSSNPPTSGFTQYYIGPPGSGSPTSQQWNTTLVGDISGNSYKFSLLFASASTTTFRASLLANGQTIASTEFTTNSQTYSRFEKTVTGIDPSTNSGDSLVLSVTWASGARGGMGTAPGDAASYIMIPGQR